MSEVNATLDLARELIARPSVTPDDAGCQDLLAARLREVGFAVEQLDFAATRNLWAVAGDAGPTVCFVGHTDVVPPGPLEQWASPPFAPQIRDGYLYGRGAADMKGSVAAFVCAAERFVREHPRLSGQIAILLTSDEEGRGTDGIRRVVPILSERGIQIDHCLVGEPSCGDRFGDTLRNGRRGSLSGTVTIRGKQGHVAYPNLCDNAIHRALPAMDALRAEVWDGGDDAFPATSLQMLWVEAGVSNDGVRSDNVAPGEIRFEFNLRYNPQSGVERIKKKVAAIFSQHGIQNYDIEWRHSAEAFVTRDGALLAAVSGAVEQATGIRPIASTAGGTSDGRFIAPTAAEVVEFGPVNATIHAVDERVSVDELQQLSQIYEGVLRRLLTTE